MKKKWLNSLAAILIATSVSIPSTGLVLADAANPSQASHGKLTDATGHWAEKTIQSYVEKGMIQGYEDGTFKPDSSMSRAELITVINKFFGNQDSTKVNFTDVTSDQWFYQEVGKAQKAKYISGYADGTFKANNPITRQEIAVLVSNILSLKKSSSATQYTDAANSPEWSKGAIGAVIDAGIMTGYQGQVFKPDAHITRAEAVTILDRALKAKDVTYAAAGVYGPETGVDKIKQNVIINAPNITLRNVEIEGNLLLGKGIGEGDVTLKNVKVHGTTTVQGGGENSIHFEDSIMVMVVVDKATGKVRIVVNGATQISNVTVQSNAKIEAETGAQINSVTLAQVLPKDSSVQLVGSFETVNIIAQNIVVDIPKGSIKNLQVGKTATDTKIDIGNEAAIISLIMNAATSVVGQGKVQNATVNAPGISMEKAPETTSKGADISSDVQLKIGGNDVKVDSPSASSAPASSGSTSGSGGSSGGSSGGGSSSPVITPLPTGPIPTISGVTFRPTVSGNVYGTVGDSVYGVSDMDGWIYLTEINVPRTLVALNEAVAVGQAAKTQVNANVGALIDSTGLSKKAVHFRVVAVSNGGQISNPEGILLYAAPSDPLQYRGIAWSHGLVADGSDVTNRRIHFTFNKILENNLTDLTALKAAITFSSDSDTFVPLQSGDIVTLSSANVIVTFAAPYTGDNNKVKLNANSVRDQDGHIYQQEIISTPVRETPVVSKMSSASSFQVGQDVAVRVNKAVTVYLVRSDLSYNIEHDIENEVVANRAAKAIIGADQVNQDVNISTADLAQGNYRLMIWGGNSISIKIVAPPSN